MGSGGLDDGLEHPGSAICTISDADRRRDELLTSITPRRRQLPSVTSRKHLETSGGNNESLNHKALSRGCIMPIFDDSASNRAEADLLRGILGPAKPRDTSLRQASLSYHRRQRRAQMTRGLIVVALIGSVGGSALIFSKNDAAPQVEGQGLPAASTGSIVVKL